MLNSKYYNELMNELVDKTGFTYDDFIVTQKNLQSGSNANSTYISITYRYNTNYYIHITIGNKKDDLYGDYSFSIQLSPGEISAIERLQLSSITDTEQSISNWIRNFKEDLCNTKANKIFSEKLSEHEHMIEKISEQVNNIEEDFFSKEEASTIYVRLDEIKVEFEKLYEEKSKENKAKLSEVEEQLRVLKQTVEQLNKKTWCSMFLSKFCNWLSVPSHRKAISTVAQAAAKAALPSSCDSIIDAIDNITE